MPEFFSFLLCGQGKQNSMKRKFRSFLNSIQSTLILYFVLLSVIPLAAVIFYTSNELVNPQFEDESLQKMELVRNSRYEAVQFWLDNSESSLGLMLTDATQNQRMVSLLAGPTLASSAPTTVRNLEQFFAEQLSQNTFFTEIFLYNLDGDIIVTSDDARSEQTVADAPFYVNSFNNESYVQSPYYDADQETMFMFITIPVRNSDDEQVGVLSGRVDLNDLSKIFTDSNKIGETDETYLASSIDGRFITPNRANERLVKTDSHAINRGSAGLTGQGIYENYAGQEVVGAYQWMPELDAILIAEIQTDEALEVSRDIANITFLISAVAILLAIGAGSYLAISFARPITELTNVATQIAQGDLSQRTAITAHNEIGRLGKAFNVMSDNLSSTRLERNRYIEQIQELNTNLEFQVSQQTRDLQIAAEVSRQVTTILDLDTLLTEIVERTQDGFDLYTVSVFLLDEDSQELRLKAATGEAGLQAIAENKKFHINDRGLVPLASRMKQAVVINDVSLSKDHFNNPLLPLTQSEVAIPMLFAGYLVGVLDFQSVDVNRFTDRDIQIFTTLGEQIAISVHNAEVFAEAQDSRREAEQANKIKSQFLASMSHELRTPLNGVLNFTQFVADGLVGDINDKQEELLRQVMSNGEHLLALINDVLDISKIESGSLKLLMEDQVEIGPILEEIGQIGQTFLGEKPVELKLDIAPDLPAIRADRRRVRQIALNLVSNACKFTTRGEILLKAYADADDLVLVVQDTGIGIELHDQDIIFETFNQAEAGVRQGEGTGLGLPISRHLARAHGGRLWVVSELGKGSTFYATLPTKTAPPVQENLLN